MKKNRFSKRDPLLLIGFFLFLSGCSTDTRELPTRGSLTVISSEDIFPAVDREVKEFERLYEQAHITHLSSTARDAIVQLLNDSVKVVVCPRDLNAEEREVIKKYQLAVDTFRVAYDAIAVLVNEKNPLKRITVQQLKSILLGKALTWEDVGVKRNASRILVALGDRNSGVYEYLNYRVTDSHPFADVVIPCSTTTHVLNYVQEHPNAIGFAGLAWLDSTPAKTRILEVGDPKFQRDSLAKTMEFFSPLQAHLYRGYYPLRRRVYVYTKDMGKGVGLGFSAFVVSAVGQKIFLANGLVPATMPVRLVQFRSQK